MNSDSSRSGAPHVPQATLTVACQSCFERRLDTVIGCLGCLFTAGHLPSIAFSNFRKSSLGTWSFITAATALSQTDSFMTSPLRRPPAQTPCMVLLLKGSTDSPKDILAAAIMGFAGLGGLLFLFHPTSRQLHPVHQLRRLLPLPQTFDSTVTVSIQGRTAFAKLLVVRAHGICDGRWTVLHVHALRDVGHGFEALRCWATAYSGRRRAIPFAGRARPKAGSWNQPWMVPVPFEMRLLTTNSSLNILVVHVARVVAEAHEEAHLALIVALLESGTRPAKHPQASDQGHPLRVASLSEASRMICIMALLSAQAWDSWVPDTSTGRATRSWLRWPPRPWEALPPCRCGSHRISTSTTSSETWLPNDKLGQSPLCGFRILGFRNFVLMPQHRGRLAW